MTQARRNHNSGIILLSALLLTAALNTMVLSTGASLLNVQKRLTQRHYQLKCDYLANSGLSISEQAFDTVPVINVPPSPSKHTLYTLADQLTPIQNLDGRLTLFRSQTQVYAVAKVDNKCQKIATMTPVNHSPPMFKDRGFL